ncbi:MAG TPA: vitamin K epoxide reductase family protein [Vicinamibacterales bacterium]|nr:vitamin K epoxide reductase family protein [Vicinamibacterales bacterium]
MTRTSRTLLLAFAALGLGASATSTYVHHQLLTQPGFTSFCDVNATVSCTEAYLSAYGSLWGVPVAVLGVFFFTLVAILAGLAGRPGSAARENVAGYIFALSTVGLAFVLYLGYAAFFVLKAFCILCVLTYVAVAGIFVVSGGVTSAPMSTLPRRVGGDLKRLAGSRMALAVLALFLAGSVALALAFPDEAVARRAAQTPQALPAVTPEQRAQLATWWEVQPKVDLPVSADGATVVVVKFNDYQCPPCRLTHDAYKGIIDKHSAGGRLKYVLKHFPLEAECNVHAPGGGHFAACEAAAAVLLARPRGTADRMEEWLFANQGPPQLTPAQVRQAARDVAGIADFDAQYPGALQEIRQDAALGEQLGVNSTPTFFINGRKIPQILQAQYFEVLIELELNRTP